MTMHWDPFRPLAQGRHLVWLVLLVLVAILQTGDFKEWMAPPTERGRDFFLGWAAARNYLDGHSPYGPIAGVIERHLHIDTSNITINIERSSHTPTAIALVIPLALIDYGAAKTIWDLLCLVILLGSIVLTLQQLKIPFGWLSIAPILMLLLACAPIRHHFIQGQIGIVLLGLLVGAWALSRNDHPIAAGILVGAAAAIKLFPGLFLAYFLIRRQWRSLAAGTATFALLALGSAALLGVGRDVASGDDAYFVSIPWRYRADYANVSLTGLWQKLFTLRNDNELRAATPLIDSPLLAQMGTYLSSAIVVLIWAHSVWKAKSREQIDAAFGLTFIAMLLLSPIAWDHYFPMLLLPWILLWKNIPATGTPPIFVILVLGCFWASEEALYSMLVPAKTPASPLVMVTALSLHNYALIALFVLVRSLLFAPAVAASENETAANAAG